MLNPELYRHHVQEEILKMLIHIVSNSPNPVHLFKVNLTLIRACIAGDECIDELLGDKS